MTRSDERAALPMGVGVTWELLDSGTDPELEMLSLTYEPGASSSEDGALLTHAGRETGLVLSGLKGATSGLGL